LPRNQSAAPARTAGARWRLGLRAVAAFALVGLACHDHGAAPRDGSSDGLVLDTPNALTLDIGVLGCGQYEAAGTCDADAAVGPCCTGAPPMTLSFAPIGSPDLTQFLWDFGDGTPTTTERAPSHVYPHPGTFRVSLIGQGPSTGAVQPPDPLTVVVDAIATGGFCDVDAQCADGLSCVCTPASGCPPAFVRGFCSAACDAAACAAGAVCAAVSVVKSVDAGAGANPSVCVASCQTISDCGPGSVCETLPARPATAAGAWTRGCLPVGALQDVGASCRDASDVLSDGACTTGKCADVGALGVCSADCDDVNPCPDGAACVALADGRQFCLLTCTASSDCGRDPLLACQPTPVAPARDRQVMVCSPRNCSRDSDCAPSGRCGVNAVCLRIPM